VLATIASCLLLLQRFVVNQGMELARSILADREQVVALDTDGRESGYLTQHPRIYSPIRFLKSLLLVRLYLLEILEGSCRPPARQLTLF